MRTTKMRKLIYFLPLLFLLGSCSDSDDGFLDGKNFSYEIFYSKSGTTIYDVHCSSWIWEPPIRYLESCKDNDYVHRRYWDKYSLIFPGYTFEDLKLPKESYSSVSLTEGQYVCSRNEIITDSIFEIKFSNNKCIINVHAVKCSLEKDQVLRCKQRIYLFNEGRFNIGSFGDYILVEKDKATIRTLLGQVGYSIPLIDFKGKINGKCNYLDQIEEVNDLNESYKYVVDKDDVRLMDEAGQLCALFNLNTKRIAYF